MISTNRYSGVPRNIGRYSISPVARNAIQTGTIDGMKKPIATGRQAENTASAAALMPAISDSTQITTAGVRTSR
ncbi:hypothetical protein D3C72_1534890 [compost metagenome]